MGRRKIRIERIKETRTRNVTFHKRKLGIMKKAYEISILCGAEVAFIALYEGKASMFCSGDLDTVIAKFAHHRQFKPVDVRYNKEFAAMCAKAKRGDEEDDEEADDGVAEDESNEAGTPMQSQVTLVNPEPPFSLAPHLTQQPQYPPPVPQSMPNSNLSQMSVIKNEPMSFYAQPMQHNQQQQQQQPGLPPHLHYTQQQVGPASHSLHNSPMMRPVVTSGHHSYPGSAHGSPMNAPVALSVQSTGNGPVMMLSQPMQQQQHTQFAAPNQYQQQQPQQPFAFAPQQPHSHAPSPDMASQAVHGSMSSANGSPMPRPVSSALAAAMPALQGHRRFSAPTSAPPTPPMQAVPMHSTGSQSPMSGASSSRLSNASARLPPLRVDLPLEERAPVVNGVVMAQPPRAGPLTALLQGELPDPSSVMNSGSNAGQQQQQQQQQQQSAVFTPSIFSPNTAALFRSLSNA